MQSWTASLGLSPQDPSDGPQRCSRDSSGLRVTPAEAARLRTRDQCITRCARLNISLQLSPLPDYTALKVKGKVNRAPQDSG